MRIFVRNRLSALRPLSVVKHESFWALGLAILPRLSVLAPSRTATFWVLECLTAVKFGFTQPGRLLLVLAQYHRGKAMPLPLLKFWLLKLASLPKT